MSHSSVNTTSGCNKVTLKPKGDQIIHITFGKYLGKLHLKSPLNSTQFKSFNTNGDVQMSCAKSWRFAGKDNADTLPIYSQLCLPFSITLTFLFRNSSPRSLKFFPSYNSTSFFVPQSLIKAYTLQKQITTVNTTENHYSFTTWVEEKSISPSNGFSITSLIVLHFYKQSDGGTEQRKKLQVHYHARPINFDVCWVRDDSKIQFYELDKELLRESTHICHKKFDERKKNVNTY